MVLNAGNKFIDLEHIGNIKEEFFKGKDVTVEYREDDCLIAVQGPNAEKLLQQFTKTDLSIIKFKEFVTSKIEQLNCEATFYRTGYTGEDGFEISINVDYIEKFADMLFEKTDIAPAGLGARDLLRLEAGLCLHGHEMSEQITPVEALLQWTIRKENQFCEFYGYEALQEKKAAKSKTKRVGVKLLEGGVPREGCELFSVDGEKIGDLTSGAFSGELKKGIGMGYVLKKFGKKGGQLLVDIRGRKKKAEVVGMPFVEHKYVRG